MFSFFRKGVDPKVELRKALEVFELPPLPITARKVLAALKEPGFVASQSAELIEADAAMSAHVLRTVNSSAFSPRRPISDISHATTILGVRGLESIVLSSAVEASYPREFIGDFDLAEFLGNCSDRAKIAAAFAREIQPHQVAECFTAALLQDLAIPFLLQRGSTYTDIFRESSREGVALEGLEMSTFGFDHTEVASWICADWGLPETIASAIRGHHGACHDGVVCPAPVRIVSVYENSKSVDSMVILAEKHGIDAETCHSILEVSQAGTRW